MLELASINIFEILPLARGGFSRVRRRNVKGFIVGRCELRRLCESLSEDVT
jgi:hypothetical protein